MARARKEVGIRRRRNGWRVFAKVNGKVYTCPQFPLETPMGELRAARDRLIEQHGGSAAPEAGSFAADVLRFLAKPEIAALPTVATYARHLALWVAALGATRTRAIITRDEIETVIQEWLTSGLAPATVYHRRTPLGRLYAVLDGEAAPNPVRATTCPDHYRPVDKSIPYETVVAILDAMPIYRGGVRKAVTTRPRIERVFEHVLSVARIAAVTIAATGIPAAELVKLHRRDFEPARSSVRMPWRDKGAGAPAHRRELMEPGVVALAALFAAACNAKGRITFSRPGLTHSFKRAARLICGAETPIAVYWLRHTFGADVYRLTRDLDTVRRLLGHVEGSIVTARYAMGAHAEVDRAALAQVATARAAVVARVPPAAARQPAPKLGHRLPTKLPAARKRGNQRALQAVS